MDNQNNPTPKHVPTEAEIARLEAEAAAALQRGEAIPRRESGEQDPQAVPENREKQEKTRDFQGKIFRRQGFFSRKICNV